MNHALPGAMLLLAASAGAAPVLDCQALRNSAGSEPPGYAGQCIAAASPRPAATGSLKQQADTGDILAYAMQLTSLGDSVETGLYRFLLHDFPAAERLGPAIPEIHTMSFNPVANRLYGIRYDRSAGGSVGYLDLEAGTFRPVSVLGIDPAHRVTGLAVDPRSGLAWLSTNRTLTNNPPLSESYLWNINPDSGAALLLTRMLPAEDDAVIIDLAMNCKGELYAHNISDDSLYRVDTGDGTLELIGSHGLPANFAQGMDFDKRDDTLYAWIYTGAGNNSFGILDTATAAFTPLAENAPRGEWVGAIPGRCDVIAIEDPSAFDGAWYARYSSGQGFKLRYIADANTWFMPWFTFTPEPEERDDDEDLADYLRWYSLQGEVEPGATEAELTIVLTTGGSFDDSRPVQRVRAGEARLSFFSCREGVLEYAFDPGFNDGLQGTIGLTRLSPIGLDCADANDRVTPADAPYDPAFTGTWFDPAADGQGVEILRIAGDEDEEIAPYFFGAWFTFEPDNEDDTPLGQHWLTLQTHTINDEGVISATIIRTTGGWFDADPSSSIAGIGRVSLTPQDACDRLLLTYEFNDNEAAGAFRDLEGEILLHRIGPCPAGSGGN